MSDELRCGSCGICENDLIYLLPNEVSFFRNLSIDLIEIEGVHFLIKRTNDKQYCPFRDQTSGNCTIYDYHPAICRLFPLEIKEENGIFGWAVGLYCPKVISNQDNFLDRLFRYIPDIEKYLDQDLIRFFAHADKICIRTEMIMGSPTKSAWIKEVYTVEPMGFHKQLFCKKTFDNSISCK